MGRRLGAVLGVLACGLAACTVDRGVPEPPRHERAAVPEDRDEPAILAALRGLDPCALLDPTATGAPEAFPATLVPVRDGPRNCSLRSDAEVVADVVAGVTVGSAFGLADKGNTFVQVPVAGAKAYLVRTLEPDEPCVVHVPVSFEYSVSFSAVADQERITVDPCAVVRGLAGAAVPKLAEPAGITAEPPLPMAEWDGCALLRDAIATGAPDAADHRLSVTGDDGVDRCHAEAPDGLGYGFSLKFSYDIPIGGGIDKTIRGTTVDVFEFGDCDVTWTNGPVETGSTMRRQQVVEVTAPACDTAESVAAAVLATMAGEPPAAEEPWHRSLTYRPGEPDVPAAEPCGHLALDLDDCQPYVPVDVPAEIVPAAVADPNVACAVVGDAVRAHVDERLRAATIGGDCVFGRPDGTLRLSLSLADEPLGAPEPGARRLSVAGHTGWLHDDGTGRFAGELALSRDRKAAGVLEVWLVLNPPPGSAAGTAPDTAPAERLEPMLADIVETHFG